MYGKPSEPGSPTHPVYNLKFPKKFEPEDGSQISQSYAKSLMPPNAAVWVGNSKVERRGSWQVSYQARNGKRFHHSKTWQVAGSERLALLDCISFLWRFFLVDNGLPNSHCPIDGLNL